MLSLITSVWSGVTGLWGKLMLGMGLALAIGTGAVWLLHQHDNGVLAKAQVSQDRAIAAAVAVANVKAQTALEAAVAQATARATTTAQIKEKINAQPVTSACVSSPAIKSLLSSVRAAHANRSSTSH